MGLDWQTVIGSVAISGIAISALAFVGRSIVNSLLARDLEAYKVRLQAAADAELERLRTELHRSAFEHEVRFSRLHDRQAEVIAEVFARLEQLHQAYRAWASPVKMGTPNPQKLGGAAVAAYNDFIGYYYPKAIWLDPETCSAINAIVDTLRGITFDLGIDVDERGLPADRDAWRAAYDKVDSDIPKARGMLDAKFRSILGVTQPVSHALAPTTQPR